MKSDGDLLTAGDVCREAAGEYNPATVRNWADQGRLPVIRTAGGVRLFRRVDVENVLADRRKSKES